MDITRRNDQCGRFLYINKSKKNIKNPIILSRIKTLRIPPAYINVTISNSPKSKIQAIGTDTKNRKQYIYNKDYVQHQHEVKFEDLILFGKKIKRIRRDINYNIKKCLSNQNLLETKECIISLVLFLIDKCNFRVGNEKYKNLYNSFGVTTLNKHHFSFNKNNMSIKFIGKKGVLNESKVNNIKIRHLMEKLCINNSKYVFSYYDNNGIKYRITEKHINTFLKKYHKILSVKMFRTWASNHMLIRQLLEFELPETSQQANKNILSIIKKTANKMHHSKNVSKKSYMNNKILDLYIDTPEKFKSIILQFRKKNGSLPTIDIILNKLLQYLIK